MMSSKDGGMSTAATVADGGQDVSSARVSC